MVEQQYCSTFVDHVWANSSHQISQSGVMDLGLSDHDPLSWTRKKFRPTSRKHNEMHVQFMKHHAIKNFKVTFKKTILPTA